MNKIKNPDREMPIINECLAATHDLLTQYWNRIADTRDESDNIVALSLSFKVNCQAESPTVKSKLGFSRRFRDERETVVDINQTLFPFLQK